jgi:hypothetical protein
MEFFIQKRVVLQTTFYLIIIAQYWWQFQPTSGLIFVIQKNNNNNSKVDWESETASSILWDNYKVNFGRTGKLKGKNWRIGEFDKPFDKFKQFHSFYFFVNSSRSRRLFYKDSCSAKTFGPSWLIIYENFYIFSYIRT